MLETRSLSKRFGDTLALDRVTLSVNPGEIYCLLGANGAGKTTLINIFLGFLNADGGEALVDGASVATHAHATKAKLAYIPEQVMLYGALTGIENLRYFAALATGVEPTISDAERLLSDAGLDAVATRRRVATYSKGMRQKVGIAVAMAKGARALLLDEPTSGLDPKAAAEFAQLLRRSRDSGVAILATTHDLFHAKQTGSRIGIMRQGQLIDEVSATDLSHADLESLYLEHMR
jgi:ABC-2 type transport system ATP-binding protein